MKYGIIVGVSIMISAILSDVEFIPRWVAWIPFGLGLVAAIFGGASFARNSAEKKNEKKKEEKAPTESSDKKEEKAPEEKPPAVKEEKKEITNKTPSDQKRSGGFGLIVFLLLIIGGVFCWHILTSYKMKGSESPKIQVPIVKKESLVIKKEVVKEKKPEVAIEKDNSSDKNSIEYKTKRHRMIYGKDAWR